MGCWGCIFVGPDSSSEREEEVNIGVPREECDAALGLGAMHMIADMFRGVCDGVGRYGVKKLVLIGMDLRSLQAIGNIALDFVICGERALVTRNDFMDDDLAAQQPVKSGFNQLSYLPMSPGEWGD